MDEDNIQLQPSTAPLDDQDMTVPANGTRQQTDPAGGSNDRDGEEAPVGSNQVFEITDDLNISPVKDEPTVEPALIASPPKPATSEPVVVKTATPVMPAAPRIPIAQPVKQEPEPIVAASTPPRGAPINLMQSRPISPPAKVVGIRQSLEQNSGKMNASPNNSDLQQVISSILPQNLRKSPEQAPATPVAQSFGQQSQQGALNRFDVPADPNLKPLRTYEGDVAEAMAHKKASTASIAIAESKRQVGEERIADKMPLTPKTQGSSWKKFAIILACIVIIGGGLYGAYYFYSHSILYPQNPQTPVSIPTQQQSQVSLVPSDTQVVIPIDNLSSSAIKTLIQAEASKPQTPDTIKEIVLTTKNADGQVSRVTSSQMIGIMGIDAPDILTRSLTDSWMLGVYADNAGENSVFVVVITDFFQDAFAGMLSWESLMADDLKQYLYANPPADISDSISTPSVVTATPGQNGAAGSSAGTRIATSTVHDSAATTSAPVVPLPQFITVSGTFRDRIIDNKDVREFVASDGTIIFLYSFVDNYRLVFTDNEAALANIADRLEQQTFVR